MKKYLNKILLLLLAVFALGGCSKEFLEEPKPASSVSEEVIFNSREGVEAYISGILRRSRAQYVDTHRGGVYSIFHARNVKGNDIINSANWFLWDYEQDWRMAHEGRPNFTWEFPYFMINQANTLINGIEASTALSDEDKAELKGQGLALRAFYYFQLAQEFQHTYAKDPSADAPPIYTELSLTGNPMSTLEEMYSLIVSDLTEAIAGLSEDRLDKSYINKAVAQGILARVYLVMENWAGAEENAHAAYGGSVEAALSPELYSDGFDDMDNPEWLWGMPNYSDQTNYYYMAPHSFTTEEGYGAVFINPNFVAKFSDTDVRKLFTVRNPANIGTWQEYATTKFQFVQEDGFSADFGLMRKPEMILIEAEALYRQDQEAAAHDLLYALQLNRDPNAVKSSNTGAALLEEILLERRKELYLELGVEWFDAKRLQRGITRDAIHRVVVNLAPNDVRFILQVPEEEIDANDAIDASVNANR